MLNSQSLAFSPEFPKLLVDSPEVVSGIFPKLLRKLVPSNVCKIIIGWAILTSNWQISPSKHRSKMQNRGTPKLGLQLSLGGKSTYQLIKGLLDFGEGHVVLEAQQSLSVIHFY